MAIALVATPTLLLGNIGAHDEDASARDLHTMVSEPVSTEDSNLPGDVDTGMTIDSDNDTTPAVEQPRPLIFKAAAVQPPVNADFVHNVFEGFQGNSHNSNMPTLRKLFGLSVQTIVIDPGHGGADPGTSGKEGLQEKNITLDIARNLKERLEKHGDYRVLLTRDKDESISLKHRIAYANEVNADLFISIHVNYLPSRSENLIETYYYGVSNDNSTLGLAQSENSNSDVAMHEFTEMVGKLGSTLKMEESKRLASEIQKSLFVQIGQDSKPALDMGIRKAPFLVIMGTDMPAVLAEVTSISNPEQEKKLHTEQYRNDIALYLESGIVNYLNRGDYIYEARR